MKRFTPMFRLVESVKSGNSEIPLEPSCPPRPTDVTDILFTEMSAEVLVCLLYTNILHVKFKHVCVCVRVCVQAVQVIAGVLVVLVTLLAINAIIQYLRQHNICRRKDYVSALPPVHFKPSSVMDEEEVLLLNDTEEPHSPPPQAKEPSPPLVLASTDTDELQRISLSSITKDQLPSTSSS